MSKDPSIHSFSQGQLSARHLPHSLLCAEDTTVNKEGTHPGFMGHKNSGKDRQKISKAQIKPKYFKVVISAIKELNSM